jgi:ubiquinone/menaquinone biosynthesis C-methylase UbiE
MDENQKVYERDARDYMTLALQPAEFKLLAMFRDRWHEMDVLDLGVGAGRTAFTFSAVARSYVGVDYAERMIALCRSRFLETDRLRFVLANATDLSSLGDRQFDLILFSYNGIDYVDWPTRRRVLSEVRRFIRPTGTFFFSSHSLHSFPFTWIPPPFTVRQPARWLHRCAKQLLFYGRQRWINRSVDMAEAHRKGWAAVRDGAHRFALITIFVRPDYEVTELQQAGFDLLAVWDQEGREMDWRTPQSDIWFHYLCRPAQ